jgi:hypothetical protein
MGSPILGDGTRNYIPIWVKTNYLQSSVIYQDANKNIGVGTTTPAAALDVNGNINTAMTYQIGTSTVLSVGNPDPFSVFLGVSAGSGSGNGNTFLGGVAGFNNSTGSANTFTGVAAGYSSTTGSVNTFTGYNAGEFNTTGNSNTFTGGYSGIQNTTGSGNTFIGDFAGWENRTGSNNTAVGYGAGYDTTGDGNTFIGASAGPGTPYGGFKNNTFIGYGSGNRLFNGSNNIYIGNKGSQQESNAIRIGDPTVHTAAYIAGIYGATTSGGLPVYINSNGQLGTSPSALRFKQQVRDMGDSTNALMKLRPVTFFYKPEYDKGERTLQYGLIAEEVAKVYPELVAYDNDGQPYSVRYQYLTTMLLNEVQKQYRRAETEAKVIEELEQRLSRLEKLVGSQLQTVAQK